MALPSSGQLSLSMIKAEFSGVNAFSGYYKGGGYVPNTAANANIPTSGLMRISNFYGGSADTTVIALTDKYITAEITGGSAYAGFRLASGGKVRARQGGSSSTYDELYPYNEWADPEDVSVGTLYECYAYVASGTTPTGPLGTWTALSTAPTWELVRSTAGTSSCTLTILIRKIGTTTTLASANIYFTAKQITAFTPVRTVRATGSGTETVPMGATAVMIAVWGGGGAGGSVGRWDTTGARGGDGGAFCQTSMPCSGGQTLNYSVGVAGTYSGNTAYAGGNSTVSSGTLSITTMQANGGQTGNGSATYATATGGNYENTSGNIGTTSGGIVGGNGGPAISRTIGGVNYAAGGGGFGADGNDVTPGPLFTPGDYGESGLIVFYYT